MPMSRPARARAVWLLAAALVTTSACSGSHTAAPQQAARAAASARAAAPLTPSASPTAGATKSDGAQKTGGSYLETTAKRSCKPDAFRTHAGLAGGALTTYVVAPHRAGTLKPQQAAVAADFAAAQLTAAAAAVKTCPPAPALAKVTTQAAQVLARTAVALRSGADTDGRIRASEALYADVLAQAGRLKLAVRRTVPSPAQLAG